MLSISNVMKTAAVAGLVAFATGNAMVKPAHADTYATRCDDDSERCFAVRCDDAGDNCIRASSYHYYRHQVYRTRSRYVCDDDGYNCRWIRERIVEDDAY
ncbi:MAG TPA: hypothetical protein VGT78_10790 [Rhizomicrobium sp.]|nr:hypothetical protein [Rhizomicrobium sp.]